MPVVAIKVSKVTVSDCPRCGKLHESLGVKTLVDLAFAEGDNAWVTCPTTNMPVTFRLEPSSRMARPERLSPELDHD